MDRKIDAGIRKQMHRDLEREATQLIVAIMRLFPGRYEESYDGRWQLRTSGSVVPLVGNSEDGGASG